MLERVFMKFTSTTAAKRSLLLVDGHVTRYNYDTLEFCRTNGIDLLPYPPHSTPFMQVLDRCFGSVKALGKEAYFDAAVSTAGTTIDRGRVISILTKTTLAALTPTVIAAAWVSTGQWPPNSSVIDTPAFVTGMRHETDATSSISPTAAAAALVIESKQSQVNRLLHERWSGTVMAESVTTLTQAFSNDPRLIDVLPIPRVDPKKKPNSRMPYHPRLLSSDEIMAEVKQRKDVADAKNAQKNRAGAINSGSRVVGRPRIRQPQPQRVVSLPANHDHVTAAAAAAVAVALAATAAAAPSVPSAPSSSSSAAASASEVTTAPAAKRRKVMRSAIFDSDSSDSSACDTSDNDATDDDDDDDDDDSKIVRRPRRITTGPPPSYVDRLNSSSSSSSSHITSVAASSEHDVSIDSDTSHMHAHMHHSPRALQLQLLDLPPVPPSPPPPSPLSAAQLAWLAQEMEHEIAAQEARARDATLATANTAADIDYELSIISAAAADNFQ
jgi:hypothetical protein